MAGIFHQARPRGSSVWWLVAGVPSFLCWATFPCVMDHILFIHLSISGHLDCFHVLAAVNYASQNTDIHISLRCYFQFSWEYTQTWNCWVIWQCRFSFFEGPPQSSSTAAVPFCTPSSRAQDSNFSTFLPTHGTFIVVVCLGGHPAGWE